MYNTSILLNKSNKSLFYSEESDVTLNINSEQFFQQFIASQFSKFMKMKNEGLKWPCTQQQNFEGPKVVNTQAIEVWTDCERKPRLDSNTCMQSPLSSAATGSYWVGRTAGGRRRRGT